MAYLNYIHASSTYRIANTGEYDASTFGTARLNLKVNSSSTAKWGLTTNTNCVEYCQARFRVHNTLCGIGRTSSISYISGDTPQRNGSSTFASNTVSATISSNLINTKSASGTSAADPKIRTSENDTGITVTSKTASQQIESSRKTTYSAITYYASRTSTRSWSFNVPTASTKGNFSSNMLQTVSYKDALVTLTRTNAAYVNSELEGVTVTVAESNGSVRKTSSISLVKSAETTGAGSATGVTGNNVKTCTWRASYYSTVSGSWATATKDRVTRRIQSEVKTVTNHAGQDVGVSYSTRWSYSTSSARKTTYSRTSVSESLHNFNI